MENENCESILKISIKTALDNYNLETAQFLAERLVAANPESQNTYLLSKTYYLSGQFKAVYSTLDSTSKHGQSIILYGTCCLKLGKYAQGEIAVRRWIADSESTNNNELSAAHHILGKLCRFCSLMKAS